MDNFEKNNLNYEDFENLLSCNNFVITCITCIIYCRDCSDYSSIAKASSSGTGKAPSPGVKKPPILSTSWAFTDNEPDTNYDHACSIANFTRKMDMENGDELKSGVFSIRMKDRQTDWFIRIKRRGEDVQGGCLSVSLFLYKDGVCSPINADIIFSIVDKEGVKTKAKRLIA